MLRELSFNNIIKYGSIYNSIHLGFNEDAVKITKDPRSSITSLNSKI